LSRVYSQGWKAAKEMRSVDCSEDLHVKPTVPENPHDTIEERASWSKGFEDALCNSESTKRASNVRFWGQSHRKTGWKPSRPIKR
jgi:hypothetical protein